MNKCRATAGNDATAKIWDADNGEKMLDLTGHAGALNSVDVMMST